MAGAREGNIAVLYVAGLGATQPVVMEGAAAPASPLAQTIVRSVVRIGGQIAPVTFSGLAPALVGVYQVNAVIPAEAAVSPDGQFEITVEADGRASNIFRLAAR